MDAIRHHTLVPRAGSSWGKAETNSGFRRMVFRGYAAVHTRAHHHQNHATRMKHLLLFALLLVVCLATDLPVHAQEAPAEPNIPKNAGDFANEARSKAEEIAAKIDQSEQAHEVSAGILKHIYKLAEFLSFPAFHWLAFGAMVAGVVSFSLQLVLAKLLLLSRMHLSFREILSDGLGLVISLTGLVLTTQAAAQNSNFTQSPAAVLSATAVGVVTGFILYVWGQRQEVQAVAGRMRPRS